MLLYPPHASTRCKLCILWISFTQKGSTELLGLVPQTKYLNLSQYCNQTNPTAVDCYISLRTHTQQSMHRQLCSLTQKEPALVPGRSIHTIVRIARATMPHIYISILVVTLHSSRVCSGNLNGKVSSRIIEQYLI